jgi:hypothetical protein
MTWFKVDDSFHSHPKVLAAEPAALGLWVVAGAWCSANLTDGFVPDHVLPRLLPDAAQLAEKLATCRLWRRAKGGYRFHDWSDYNPSSDEVNKEREAARQRMRELRANRRANSRGSGSANSTKPAKKPGVFAQENSNPAGQPTDCSGEQPAHVRENFAECSQPRPDPTRLTTTGPYVANGRTTREMPPPYGESPTRVEALITWYRDESPRGLPSRQAERLAGEIHQLITDGFSDDEIRQGLAQLRRRRVGPGVLAALVDELANHRPDPAPGNVIALRSDPRPSTTDQRVAEGLALAARLAAREASQ